ncbi:MAG: TrkH family potassium uptake protein [Alphaproteobacteria bacterium]|nr:TrkH family potassium uptake protein [Alphaproteobacteria bacterium]
MPLSPVFHILGMLLSLLAGAMIIPAGVDFVLGYEDWTAFLAASAITLFFGFGLLLSTRIRADEHLGLRQAFLLTNLAWVLIGIFGGLRLMLANTGMGLTYSNFESMSGITTTGSTIIPVIETMSPGVLVWRALLQWLGGIGIIVMALAVLPMLSIGGMQLFKTESYETPDKVVPRAAELAGGISFVYGGLTVIWTIMLYSAGLPIFDAVTHAMTTLATGGFSTRTDSIGAFNNAYVEWVVVMGMIVGSLPFAHYLAITRGGWGRLTRDPQVRWFLVLLLAIAILITWQLSFSHGKPLAESIRLAVFNTVSMMTGTGYGNADFGAWGGSATVLLFVCMFIGGCAGSTTCGIKMFRLQVLASTAKIQLSRLLRPHAVVVAYYNKRPVPETVMDAVMGFFYLYVLCFVFIAALLGLTGLDLVTALSGAATAISNVGPGLGDTIGPAGNFETVPMMAKWVLCAGMIVGRLELFTVLVMLAPGFWRR